MRRAITLGALAAACLALLLVVPALRRSASTRVGDSAASARERAELVEARVARQPESAPSAVPAPLDARRDSVAPNEAPAPTCVVRVVDAATKAPLPDARLWIQRADVDVGGPEWWRAMRRFNDVEPVLQSGFGDEHALDARGEVRVPRPGRALVVAAALGDLHGEAELGPDDVECVIELERFHALTVEVVDRAGAPVPHALVALFWGELSIDGGTHFLPADERGRLFVPKLAKHIWGEDHGGTLRLTLAGGTPCEPEIAELSLAAVPSGPVRFVAGDFASVVVQLTDSTGHPLALDGMAYVEIDTDAVEQPTLALRGGASLFLPLDEGRAVFPNIGLGLALEIGANPRSHRSSWREVSGPTAPGEVLQVLIPAGERVLSARGTVTAPGDGARQVFAWGPSRASFTANIAADGSFEGHVGNIEALDSLAAPWTLELRSHATLARARVVPRLDEEPVLDFGAIRFESLPALVDVRVSDESGAPVSSAQVHVLSATGKEVWSCDDSGRCSLRGEPADLPWTIRAAHPDWIASSPQQVVAAGAQVELVMRRGAALTGVLLLPERCAPSKFSLDLEHEARASDFDLDWRKHRSGLDERARFRLPICDPGRARLAIYNDGNWVHAVPDLELVAGETTELDPIDLRDELHPFALTFELASGEPWLDGHLEVREPDGQLTTWTRIGPDGRAWFLARRPNVDLWACGRGGRAQLFEGVLDGDRLVLESAPSVVLRLERAITLPGPPLALMVRAWATAEDAEFEPDVDIDIGATPVRADGTALLRVPATGEYELEWFVQHLGTGVELAVEQDEAQTIRVEDDATAAVDVLLTADELERALRAARGE